MLSADKVREIQLMLAKGDSSRRAIARAAGVSRNSVAAIALDVARGGVSRPRPADSIEPIGPLARCPTCGGRVHVPCLLCTIRGFKRGAKRPARRAG